MCHLAGCWRQRSLRTCGDMGIWGPTLLSAHFCREPKAALKNKVFLPFKNKGKKVLGFHITSLLAAPLPNFWTLNTDFNVECIHKWTHIHIYKWIKTALFRFSSFFWRSPNSGAARISFLCSISADVATILCNSNHVLPNELYTNLIYNLSGLSFPDINLKLFPLRIKTAVGFYTPASPV